MQLVFEKSLLDLTSKGKPMNSTADLDAMVSLGGDGTLLRAARYLDGADVPILGVTLGRLGSLGGCSPREFPRMLPRLAKGNYTSDTRMVLEATTGPGGG